MKKSTWKEDYWLLLMQLYMQKPIGVKPLYARASIALCMELHLSPKTLHDKMLQLETIDSPHLEQLWNKYSTNPRQLKRAADLLRSMSGFGTGGDFFSGIDVRESFEADFRPLPEDKRLMPITLIIILDLYYHLTPITMVAETPEVQELSQLLRIPSALTAEVLDVFQFCDPYLNRTDLMIHPLLAPCHAVWDRFEHTSPKQLNQLARQLKEYFTT